MSRSLPRRVAALVLALSAAAPAAADDLAAGAPAPQPWRLEDPPLYGAGYDRYEPTFYTGFAPRVSDPARIHLHLGRGNQLRVTAVLSEQTLGDYARDLLHRQRTYRGLIERGRVVPTQNRGFEDFERTIEEVELARLVKEEDALPAGERVERNLHLLERLNPGRVFRIRMPADQVVRRWVSRLRPEDRAAMTKERRLELLGAMLPTRLWVAEHEPGIGSELEALVRSAPISSAPSDPATRPAFEAAFFRLLDRVSGGLYPRRDRSLAWVEFTAIYPVGTVDAYTEHAGRRIPLYPTPGRRALTTHQRTRTVDHIPTTPAYSYSPWIPYMHVGKTLHNSFHTLWWSMERERTPFLPAAWRTDGERNRDGEPFRYLWLLSRGPMSHGCTHLNTGHILELRQILPAEAEPLYRIDAFLNPSHLYDVFDVEGDFQPEVMGVRYYVAYSLEDRRPHRLRARNERRAYYEWLYGGELRYDERGGGWLHDLRDARFVGRTALGGSRYQRLPLYEAAFEPQRFQFYRLVDIAFARELRRVGIDYPGDGLAPRHAAR
jgi:hypothetical protein